MSITVLLGVVVGLVLGLTGAGGAILAVPLLIFVLHLQMVEASPVALMAACLSAALGTIIGLLRKQVRYRAAAFMAMVGMAFTPLGIWISHQLPNQPLSLLFAGVLAWVALRMFRQARSTPAEGAACSPVRVDAPVDQSALPPCRLDPATGRFVWTAACARALVLSGAVAGFLSGLLGVGGGFVIVPALKRATDASMKAIVATSLAVITLVSGAGVATTAFAGHLDWAIGLPFSAGAVAGMLIGRAVASRISGAMLQKGFAVVAGLIAIGMVVRVFVHG